MRATSLLGCLAGFLVLFQISANSSTLAGQADLPATIHAFASLHGFNGTVLVEQHGKIIYEGSTGLADRNFEIPATNETRYRIASITKAFTSVIILQLFEEGKIDLHGSLKTYLPDFHGEGGDQITIQNLLNHTSGIPNLDVAKTYEDSIRLGLPMYETLQSPDVIVEKYCTGKLTHPVGAAFDYNNCDYILLGLIIEKLTGKSYEDTLRQRILTPLRMNNSGIRYQKNIIHDLANTYHRATPGAPLQNDQPLYNENLFAAGAMFSTAGDILKFSNALFGNRLLKPSTLARMLSPGLGQYGDGVWIRTFGTKKLRVVERYGKGSGANVLLACFPDDDTTIILLSNTDDPNLGDFYKQIANRLLN